MKSLASSYLKSTAATIGALVALSAGPAVAQDACTPHTVDLGDDMSLEVGCEPLKIAYFIAATNNAYVQAGLKGAQDAAAEFGVELEVFDANWDAARQFNQVQNVLAGEQFNAFLAQMNDGNQSCRILTEEAYEAGVLVEVINGPLCDRATNEGEELWQPGTLNFVGGSQGREAFRSWMFEIAEAYPGPQKAIVITGPELLANTRNMDLAVEDVTAAHPEFEVVATVRTDYSLLQGNEKSLPAFQANPDTTLIISNYSDLTRGALAAMRQVVMDGDVTVLDYGGNEWSFDAVEAGQIESTRLVTPYTEAYLGVEALVKAWNGETVERYTPLDTAEVNSDTLADYAPEY